MRLITKFPCAVLFGAALLSGAAHAGTEVDTHAFTAQMTDSWYRYAFDMKVLSDTEDAVKIALSGVGADEAWGGLFSKRTESGSGNHAYSETYGDYAPTDFKINVKQGYRIASFTLTGNTIGSLNPAVFVPSPGKLGTDGMATSRVNWTLGKSYEPYAERVSVEQIDVQGIEQFSLHYTNVNPEQEFTLSMNNMLWAELKSGESSTVGSEYPGSLHASSVTLDYSDIVLTVNVVPVSAVPEPGTYTMLLGGLALVAGVARRRRQ